MRLLPFKSSDSVSLGIELEYQIVDPRNGDLVSRAKDLIRNIEQSVYSELIKPEITQSMIEINSSVHCSPGSLYEELKVIRDFLQDQALILQSYIAGGGTHPFQKWSLRKIFPTKRFKTLLRQYQYLSKRSTVFGQHIHVGCPSGEDAIYLTHALTRYAPHLIAMSASSPFYQGVDTHYHSSRSTVFNAFPLSGVMPYLKNWQEFSDYYHKMHRLKIVSSMKDFYWDIRPKPEFGTIEIRVCDTPLTIKRAVELGAYAQVVAQYLLHDKPISISHDLYDVYNYNRFQASRYGFDGDFIDPITLEHKILGHDILDTINLIEKHTHSLGNSEIMLKVVENVINKQNDAKLLKEIYEKVGSLPKLVLEQCKIWAED